MELCYLCGKNVSNLKTNLDDFDCDNMTFLEKLQLCIKIDLILKPDMRVCNICVKKIRIVFSFHEIVLKTQASFNQPPMPSEIIKIELDETFQSDCNSNDEKTELDFYIKEECSILDFPMVQIDSLPPLVSLEYLESSPQLSCDYCSRKFYKNWQLSRHIQRNHTKTRDFLCRHCPKTYKLSSHLKQHEKTHIENESYSCSFCERSFQHGSSLKRHLRTHIAPLGRKSKHTPFLCNICGKKFPFSNSLQRHMRIHMGIRPHKCDVCTKKFAQATHLHVHMRTHTGEKPFICELCGEQFITKSVLEKHVYARHKD